MSTAVKSPLKGHTLDPAKVSWNDYSLGRRRGQGRASKYDWDSLLDGSPQILEVGVEIEDAVKFRQALYGKLKERSDLNRKTNPGADPYILLAQVREEENGKNYLCFEAVYSREQLHGRHPDVDGLFDSYISRSEAMSAAYAARKPKPKSKAEKVQEEAPEAVGAGVSARPATTPRFPAPGAAATGGKAPFRSPK